MTSFHARDDIIRPISQVHDRGRCISGKSERKVNPGDSVRFTLDRSTREISATKMGGDGSSFDMGVLWSNVGENAEVRERGAERAAPSARGLSSFVDKSPRPPYTHE